MSVENQERLLDWDHSGTSVDDSALDVQFNVIGDRAPISSPLRGSEPSLLRRSSSRKTENETDGLCFIRRSYERQGISVKGISIILQSWRNSTI